MASDMKYEGDNIARADDPLGVINMLRSLDEDLTLIKDVLASLNKQLQPILVQREDVLLTDADLVAKKMADSDPPMSDLSLKVNGMQAQARDIRRQISTIIDQVHL